jgi:DNA polymerase III alpha subunit
MKHSKNIWEKPGYGVSGRCNKIHHFAGVPASDGDVLRRAMSGKGRSGALQNKRQFFFACCQKDIPYSQEIYRQ